VAACRDAQQDSDGSKWSISALAEWMRQQGHDWDSVWGSIKHMIAKSLIAIQPILQYNYRSAAKPDDDGFSCFEVYAGFRLPQDCYLPSLF
jgi:hypothetical protein